MFAKLRSQSQNYTPEVEATKNRYGLKADRNLCLVIDLELGNASKNILAARVIVT